MRDARVPLGGRLDLDRAQLALEIHRDVLGLAEPELLG
jgi:hypothetical protein